MDNSCKYCIDIEEYGYRDLTDDQFPDSVRIPLRINRKHDMQDLTSGKTVSIEFYDQSELNMFVGVYGDSLDILIVDEAPGDYQYEPNDLDVVRHVSLPINYCPKCGRKLRKDET